MDSERSFFICSLHGHLLCSGQSRRSNGLLAPASVFRYDDLLEFYLSGAELVLPEQFHTEVLLTETLDDLAAFLLARYARENLRYRKCKFCGRYFGVVRNYKSEYCDRLIDGSTKRARTAVRCGSMKNASWKIRQSRNTNAPTRRTTPAFAMV